MRPEITLDVEPGVTKTWDAFCRESPPYSIALDGYVNGPPAYDQRFSQTTWQSTRAAGSRKNH